MQVKPNYGKCSSVPVQLGQRTLALLKMLKPTAGEHSFEELCRRLLARLTGVPLRRARSGPQHGVDALAEVPFAVEFKRYGDQTSLSSRQLRGHLDEAASYFPDLQLWILVSTKDLGASEHEELRESAWARGLGLLVLDPSAAQPFLGNVQAIAALCATAPELSVPFLREATQANSQRPATRAEVAAIRSELQQIRSWAGFDLWVEYLRRELLEQQPLWRQVVRRNNENLVRRIDEAGQREFGTSFVSAEAIPRTLIKDLGAWFESEVCAEKPVIGVVTGDRYDGKTWLVFQWLREVAADLPIPVFFVSSKRGLGSNGRLSRLLAEELERCLPPSQYRHIPAFLERQASSSGGCLPWALVVVDGLNEYEPREAIAYSLVSEILGVARGDSRPALVLLTVRSRSWVELRDGLAGSLDPQQGPLFLGAGEARPPLEAQFRESPLGPFDDAEFTCACGLYGLTRDVLDQVPNEARSMLRKPRYLGLVARFAGELRRYTAVTPEVLSWLDLKDKTGRGSRHEEGAWDDGDLRELLKRLARAELQRERLDSERMADELRRLTAGDRELLKDLVSEGVVRLTVAGYEVEPERLRLGRALHLVEELCWAHSGGQSLKERLRDVLEPLHETDEAVAILRSAVSLALLPTKSPPFPDPVVDCLVEEWLELRNLGVEDLEAIYALRSLLYESFLRMLPRVWTEAYRHTRLRDAYWMVFGEVLDTERESLAVEVGKWFRLVPAHGSAFLRQRRTKRRGGGAVEIESADPSVLAQRIRRAAAASELADLRVEISATLDVVFLQQLGLYLVSRCKSLVGPGDLFALLASRAIAEELTTGGDGFVLRTALEEVPHEWFEREESSLPRGQYGPRLSAFRELVAKASRADLTELEARLPVPRRVRHRRADRYWRAVLSAPDATDGQVLWASRRLWSGKALRPSARRPSGKALGRLRAAARRALQENRLGVSRRVTEADHQFEEVLPLLAAWAPVSGMQIVRAQLRQILQRVENGDQLWGQELCGHACLLRGAEREATVRALTYLRTQDPDLEWESLATALMPGFSRGARADLVLNHGEEDEPLRLYEAVEKLADTAFSRYLERRLVKEHDPVRKRRLRLMLSRAPEPRLPASERAAVLKALAEATGIELFAALELASKVEMGPIPLELLNDLAAEERQEDTYAAHFAAQLLFDRVVEDENSANLGLEWQAWFASRSHEKAVRFLDEVSAAIKSYREQVLAATSSSTRQRTTASVHDTYWADHSVPVPLLDVLEEQRLSSWLETWEVNIGLSRDLWAGLLLACFQWAVCRGSEAVTRLWPLVDPFRRERFGGRTSWNYKGVDCVLSMLNWPESDDRLARSLLKQQTLDARSDWELLPLSLAARFTSCDRLRAVARELVAEDCAVSRSRACLLLGWLAGETEILEQVSKWDPSLWVRRVAKFGHEATLRESWCRHWWGEFLTAKRLRSQWAAGQLFASTADMRTLAWAEADLKAAKVGGRRTGEAWLLLWSVEKAATRAADELKKRFLGSDVSSLEGVAYPWRRDDDWALRKH